MRLSELAKAAARRPFAMIAFIAMVTFFLTAGVSAQAAPASGSEHRLQENQREYLVTHLVSLGRCEDNARADVALLTDDQLEILCENPGMLQAGGDEAEKWMNRAEHYADKADSAETEAGALLFGLLVIGALVLAAAAAAAGGGGGGGA